MISSLFDWINLLTDFLIYTYFRKNMYAFLEFRGFDMSQLLNYL